VRTFLICFGAFAVVFLLFALALRNPQQPVASKPAAHYVIVCNNDKGTTYLTNERGKVSADPKQAAVFNKEDGIRTLNLIQQRASEKGDNPAEFMLLQLPEGR